MKFTKEQRLEIGKEIYTRRISIYEAAVKYNINVYTARDYMRLYRSKNNLGPANKTPKYFDDLKLMSKDELINEVIKARKEAKAAKDKLLASGVEE